MKSPFYGAALVAALLAGSAGPAPAQAQTPAVARRRACNLRPAFAVEEVMALNFAVNRFDAWVAGEEWAKADFESWARNFRLGWEWDENNFVINMIMHPFHGSQYFNAGRSNCLTYWESVPVAFFGSWVWEFFGETHRPSLNDFFMTSFGGIALGEMTHRVTATIRDNRATGAGRLGRESVSLLLDPIGSLNRLFRGQWKRVGPNPAEHDPGAFVFRLNAGAQAAGTNIRDALGNNVISQTEWSPTVLLDLNYGDVFDRPFLEPFDVFSVRAEIRGVPPALNLVRASGRIYQKSFGRSTKLVFNHRYEYVNTPSHQFGWQSVEMGLVRRWNFGKGYGLRTTFSADAAFMGAIDAPYAGVGERTYDFGPGAGVIVELAFVRNNVTYFTWHNRGEFMHSVSGASANHLIGLSGLEGTIPITRGLGLGFYISGDQRFSWYEGVQEPMREFAEGRLFVTWTSAKRAGAGIR